MIRTILLSSAVLSVFGIRSEELSGKPTFRFGGGEAITIHQVGLIDTPQGIEISQVVTSDGLISVPGGGTVNVMGKTLQEATDAISKMMQQTLGIKTPRVSIAVAAIPPRRIYVQGEVLKPQSIILPLDHEYTLAAALAEAGGYSEDADLTRIKVVRRRAGQETQVFVVDASVFGRSAQDDLGPVLQSGDVVVVPRAESISVTGEIHKPGFVGRKDTRVPPGQPIRLSHLIVAAGGLKPAADRRNVRLIRSDAEGKRSISICNAESALNSGDTSSDPVLKDGDQIVVPTIEGITVAGKVAAAGIFYPIGNAEKMKVSQLIALAGGFGQFAKKSSVVVIFKGRPGQPVRVDLEKVFKGEEVETVEVGPGDMVFVPESAL